ncbi:DUF922 domain-containing protein [Maribacter chungangensis]|uniref:DUF922 domain-containing protein n=1 Tax=Maribacter chungangensis TaxID=1069117 RepID=A0ABW3B4G4_9FLAO
MIQLASPQDFETVSWKAEERLSWDDFRGDVPQNARAAAITASGITYSFSTSGTKDNIQVDFKIDTFFYPAKSWYQPALCDSVILSHEQLHFDISELFARKFKKRLENEKFTYGTVKARVKLIYREINEELANFQQLYDKETNFSRDGAKQEEWIVKIANALQEE